MKFKYLKDLPAVGLAAVLLTAPVNAQEPTCDERFPYPNFIEDNFEMYKSLLDVCSKRLQCQGLEEKAQHIGGYLSHLTQ